jgi:hypothetical protein
MKRLLVLSLILTIVVVGLTVPAAADHTAPREPIAAAETSPAPAGTTSGEGTWEYIFGLPPNPGTDLERFRFGRKLFISAGTLGGAPEQHVGQRIVRLLNGKGKVAPRWVADHGSAACATNASAATGLQHDASIARRNGVKLIVDTTDSAGPEGRCHDPSGGGIELIDVTKLNKAKFEPREIHLTRHQGTSHNATVDATRPWIIYNSSSQFSATAQAQIDVLDIRSCMKKRQTLEQRRKSCRPKVFRMQFSPGWTTNVDREGEPIEGYDSSCHDIIARPGRLYCAALSGTAIFDVRNIANPRTGAVKGEPLPCEVIEGTATTAKVTDCANILTPGEGESIPQADGWRFLGSFHHPGRDCGTGPEPPNPTNCNNNLNVPSSQGVAVSHEAVPTPDKKFMFVTDERGGGIVPGGASCSPEEENPYGNGGVHMFDITDPASISYVMTPDDVPAVFIGSVQVPSTTFCTSHRLELIPGEQRFVISWYSQGTKIVDYFFDESGKVIFRETASYVPDGSNQWAVQPFKIVKNDDGTKTYYMAASDISRGIDVFSWTGPPNPKGSAPPAELLPARSRDGSAVPLALLGVMLFPIVGARRSRRVV